MLNISIPEPCHEDWSAMTPTQKGAFCTACSKEVMDFSNMSDDAIKNYFIVNAGKKTCGRFRKEQLKGLNIVVDEQVIYTNIALWKKFLAVVVICFGALFTSCTSNKTTDKVLPETQVTRCTTMGVSFELMTTDTVKKEMPLPVKKIVTTTGFCAPKFIPRGEMEIHIQGNIPDNWPTEKEYPKDTIAIPVEAEQVKDTARKAVDTCTYPVFL